MAATAPAFRNDLSMPAMLRALRREFSQSPTVDSPFSEADVLMSALAVYSFKYPSLLQFDRESRSDDEPLIRANLSNLFGVELAPSDTQLRARLDRIDPDVIRSAMQSLWTPLQRGKALEPFRFLGEHLLLSFDGTGQFASGKISCPHCCVKHTREGDQFYHQLFAGVLVHPDIKQVLPIEAEPITRGDGDNKNDCERNAAKRAMTRLRERFSRHKFIIVEDALAANGPHLRLLHSLDLRFIIGVKFTDHAALADAMQQRQIAGECHESERAMDGGGTQGHRYYNDLALNASHPDVRVNVLEYWETDAKGKERYFAWVTDITITDDNAWEIARGGRARWRIENETFNTLKNQGYQLEHNFGHGKQHLSSNFALLCLTAFLIDQIQAHCCRVFQAIREKLISNAAIWERMRGALQWFEIPSWEAYYEMLRRGSKARVIYDTG